MSYDDHDLEHYYKNQKIVYQKKKEVKSDFEKGKESGKIEERKEIIRKLKERREASLKVNDPFYAFTESSLINEIINELENIEKQ